MSDLKELIKKLPDAPGVYLHKDALGNIIYVGKAISLRSRVRQYFQSSRNMDPKVRAMVANIAEFETITTGSEMEALILECSLIKKYMPKYNVLLRDDKTYPFIKVTLGEDYPRVLKTRRQTKDGSRYFGPFTDAGAVNRMVDLLNQVYCLKRCTPTTFPKGFSPCLNYHIHQCDGICAGKGNREEYLARVDSAMEFLRGRDKNLVRYLREKMQEAAEAMNYEEAARYRDLLRSASAIHEKQRVVLTDTRDIDVVLPAGEGSLVVFYVRDGKLSGRDTFEMEVSMDEDAPAVLGAFLKQHYGSQGAGPVEILLPVLPEEPELLEAYLGGLWHRKVQIRVPEKGEKKALLDLASQDAGRLSEDREARKQAFADRNLQVRRELSGLLRRMDGDKDAGDSKAAKAAKGDRAIRSEAYDLSNTNGLEAVGAMVVFRDGSPDKKAYRRFRIRTVEGPDDYASLQEVLYRRLRRGLAGDPGFLPLPDLILVDGGAGHVSEAAKVLSALGLEIPLAGMVKDDRHRTRGLVYLPGGGAGDKTTEEPLAGQPALYRFLGTVQEEVHRFAIDYHRKLRDKKPLGSVLDGIPGVGPARRNALLARFGSVENIRAATEAELASVPGIPPALAAAIRQYFVDIPSG
jgi:excinuclease ABC subunit C